MLNLNNCKEKNKVKYVVCNEFKQKDSIAFLNYICNNSDVISMTIQEKIPNEKMCKREFDKLCKLLNINKEEAISKYNNQEFINEIYNKVKDTKGIVRKWTNGNNKNEEIREIWIKSDIVSILSFGKGVYRYYDKTKEIQELLKEDFIKREESKYYFHANMYVYYYRMTEKLKEMLIEEVQKVKNIYYIEFPDFPEDFVFYRKGKCWVTITSHEEECYITLENEKEYQELTKLGIELD